VDRTVLEVHGCVLGLAEAGEAHAEAGLTRAERRECAALVTPAGRADYRAGRLAAKRAAARLAGDAPDSLGALRRFAARRRAGAPPTPSARTPGGRWRAAPVALSLAHRDGRGAAASAPPGTRVGVDVERVGAVDEAHVRWFAGEDERARGPRDAAALWALKEAAWKALALGPSLPLRALALEFTADGALAAVTVDGRRAPARGALLRPWAGHVVAVVVVGDA
jgi:phosphopantetheinyl transferase (holo-ACP synthase)